MKLFVSKRLLQLALHLCWLSAACAQDFSIPPKIEWQQSFGGDGLDSFYALALTSDGGFIVGGQSNSQTTGNKTSPLLDDAYRSGDYWVIRLDSHGNKLWERTFGGISEDALTCLQQTADGGFILGGYSNSPTNATKTSPSLGGYDFWVIRLDANGNELWDHCYGGNSGDSMACLQQLPDGGFIFGGYSWSGPSGNKTSPRYGSVNYWLVRTDAEGNELWDQSYGASWESLRSVLLTQDGGFILGGESDAATGDNKTSPGFDPITGYCQDLWIVKTDANGVKRWENLFGGIGTDHFHVLRQASDGGFLLGSSSRSDPATGNKTSPRFSPDYDYWVIRTDAAGKELWDQSYGCTGRDLLGDLFLLPDQGFIALGVSGAVLPQSGNRTSPGFGSSDFWMIRADASGNKIWETVLGGYGQEGNLFSFGSLGLGSVGKILATPDGGFLVGGSSDSGIGGNKTTANYGGFDFWLVKLSYSVPPRLACSPLLLTNAIKQCESAQHTFQVWNDGFGILTYTSVVDVPWLSISPPAGVCSLQTNTHILTADTSLLPLGTNKATITLLSDGEGSSPLLINYTLQINKAVLAPPRLQIPTNSILDPQRGFRFQLLGTSYCFSVVTDCSTNLKQWFPLQTNHLDGSPLELLDPAATNSPFRFYRSRTVP